jgi:exonuclease III
LILHRAKYESITTGRPVFVTGDFNSPAEGPDSGAYLIASGVQSPVALSPSFKEKYHWTENDGEKFKDFKLMDTLAETPPERRSGNFATFTAFRPVKNSNRFTRIDFIFGGSSGGWSAKAYHVGNALYDNGVYHSDHRPAYTDLAIER